MRRGDGVALFASNCPEYLEILFSVWQAGGVAVPISSRLHAREAAALLDSARAKVCFATADIAEASPASSPLSRGGDRRERRRGVGDSRRSPPSRVDLADDAWIFFTSGTTGRAKGARLSHGNLLSMTAAYYADVSELRRATRSCTSRR